MCEQINEPKFQINVLPAAHGDCIHLRFYSVDNESAEPDTYRWYNIVIDSGPGTFSGGFSKLMKSIAKKEERVDLLCFTHMDNDHMLGARNYLGTNTKITKIERIWLNVPPKEIQKAKPLEPSDARTTDARRTFELYEYILWHKIPCDTEIKEGETLCFGDVMVQVLLPNEDLLKKYFEEWDTQITSRLCSAKGFDNNPANGGSIVFIVWAEGKKLLFTGDAFAKNLAHVATRWAGDGFDFVKLPHHGSNANISEDMLNAMKCKCFAISANGSSGRPAQETVELLGDYGSKNGGVKLFGNHPRQKWGVDEELGVEITTPMKIPFGIPDDLTP